MRNYMIGEVDLIKIITSWFRLVDWKMMLLQVILSTSMTL